VKSITKLWIGIGILIIFSPLGLILPERFKAGSAWGEWGDGEIQKLVGYVPAGFKKFSSLWSAPIPDYTLKGWEEMGLGHLSFGYILSAIAGITVTIIVILIIGKILVQKKD